MAGPSAEIPPNALWARITALPRPSQIVPYPRLGEDGEPMAELAIWILTQEEQMACAAAAEMIARKMVKELPKQNEAQRGYNDLYQNAAATEIIFRAARRKDDLTLPFFPGPEAMRRSMSLDEIGVLFDAYVRIQVELGPIVADMEEDEVEAWIERLGKGGAAFPLDLLSPAALNRLVLSMASRLWTSRTDTSSPGSPPEEPTSQE